MTVLDWAEAVLYNGLGRYEEARVAALRVTEHPQNLASSNWCMLELIEAAVRSGHLDLATATHERLRERTAATGTEFALGVEARSRALLRGGELAESAYREAIERLGGTHMRADLARAHLLYGEWLRREKRRLHARHQLRTAYEQLSAIGMEAFAERAAKELAATGETVRKRSAESLHALTPQELQIARLVVEHRTNAEIAARLFLSARTVEWHLRKVFTKLDVKSRKDLRESLVRAG
jgi:DNA-binding CsgD family transcriptional regulator